MLDRHDARSSSLSSYGTFRRDDDNDGHGDSARDHGTGTGTGTAHAIDGDEQGAPDSDPSTSFFTRLLFLFVEPLARRSRTRKLQLDDVWPLASENSNARASGRFRAEYARSNALWLTIARTERRAICVSAVFAMFSVACVSAVPLLLFRLLRLVMARNARDTMAEVLVLLGGIHCGVVFGEISARHYHFRMFSAQVRAVTSIRSLVFEKSIDKAHMSQRRRKGRSIATIATIYSTNLIYVSWMITRLHNSWIAVAKLAVLLLMLHETLHVSMRVIATSLSTIGVVMLLLALVVAKASQKSTKKRAKTLNAVFECFHGVQAIKLHAWERKMQHKILRARTKEEAKHRRAVLLRTLRFCCIWESPALASVAIFYALAMHDVSFSPATVFTALVLFDRIQTEIYALIYAVRICVDGAVALRRIQKYLWHCDAFAKSDVQHVDTAQEYAPNVVVALENAFFTDATASSTDYVLANVSVRAKAGELVVVCGKAGAGKSTLLASLLGEVVRVRGRVYVSGQCKIAYCSEEPWLQTLSVRDNILFGEAFDERKYHCVLDACCLVDDLNALPDGDTTMVGPKGINLSGGQKARVALARALYSDADLFVLDCPLASADAIVQSDVFRKCFLELLRHKTIVLATHNPEIISSDFVDRVWHVDAQSVTEVDRNDGATSSSHTSRRVRRLADSPPWRSAVNASASPTDAPASATSLAWVNYSFNNSPSSSRVSRRTLRQSQRHGPSQREQHAWTDSSISSQVAKDLLWPKKSAGWQVVVLLWTTLFVIYSALGVAKNFWLVHWSTLDVAPFRLAAMRDAATVYGVFTCTAFAVVLSATLVLCYAIFMRSQTLFRTMTDSLLRAPMGFFYRTPIGAILLRYSSDMQSGDLFISYHIAYLLRSLLSVVTAVGTVCYLLGGIGAFIAVATLYICREIVADRMIAQIFTVRDKLDGTNLNYVSEALDGSAVIRAFGAAQVQRFRLQHGEMLDNRSRIAYAVEVFNDWVLIRYSLIVGVFLALVAVILAFGSLSPSALGLVLHCIFSIQSDLVAFSTGLLSATVHLTSIKSIMDFQCIEPEEQEPSEAIPASVAWPPKGDIVFDRVWFTYDATDSAAAAVAPLCPPRFALRDVSFSVRGGEKIGVVGRTGSGKSTLAMALFRVHEAARGRILVDGMDISRLRLRDLRSRLCIIPQTPLFYRCSVRRYLDPFDEFDDAALWRALKTTGLTATRSDGQEQQPLFAKSLEKQLHENGENWSLGERQMLALARALLKPSRILILDEPFSSVDQDSDRHLLEVVEHEFARSTVFLITHRLDQVLGFDQIVVMDDGKVIEVGSAQELVENPSSAFYEFLETTLLTF